MNLDGVSSCECCTHVPVGNLVGAHDNDEDGNDDEDDDDDLDDNLDDTYCGDDNDDDWVARKEGK